MSADALRDTAAKGVEALNLLVAERDALREKYEQAHTKNIVLEQELAYHKGALTLVTGERDHYMRYSTELVARLNNVQILINETVQAANSAAYKPSAVPKPKITDADIEAIPGFLRKIAENGGSDNAPPSGS